MKKQIAIVALILFSTCMAMARRAQVSGSTTLTVVSAQPGSLLAGCTYIGAGGCGLPGGWQLVVQQDFECGGAAHGFPTGNPSCTGGGMLPVNQNTAGQDPPGGSNTFVTAQNHTPGGQYSFGGLYAGDGSNVNWLFNRDGNNAVGSYTSLYYSYWDYVDPNGLFANGDYLEAALNKTRDLGCGISFNAQADLSNRSYRTTNMIASGTGDPDRSAGDCPGIFFYNRQRGLTIDAGRWEQHEFLFTPSTTPFTGNYMDGTGNGTLRMWVDGNLLIDATGVNANDTASMANPMIWIGGFITSWGDVAETFGCGSFSSTGGGTCPGSQPGSGAPQPFHRYLDDIIILKQ